MPESPYQDEIDHLRAAEDHVRQAIIHSTQAATGRGSDALYEAVKVMSGYAKFLRNWRLQLIRESGDEFLADLTAGAYI